MQQLKVICGNNTAKLKSIPDNTFDAMATDPPYGLGTPPDPIEVLTDWLAHGYHEVKNKGGFMGKTWDRFVPQPVLWKECFRVLKPGAHTVVACGTRTVDWMMLGLRLAGFEIRDVLCWHFGSGFPKSMDISKAIDKQEGIERNVIGKKEGTFADIRRDTTTGQDGLHGGVATERPRVEVFITEPATDAAKQWEGWGTGLKPATEFWILCRKPISEKTVADNVLKWGTGALNIDGSRIGYQSETDYEASKWGRGTDITGGNLVGAKQSSGHTEVPGNKKGRWPANLILQHHPECVCTGTKKIKGHQGYPNGAGGVYSKEYQKSNQVADNWNNFSTKENNIPVKGHADANGEETIEVWNCHPDCPVKIMDDQSGEAGAQGYVPSGQEGKSKGIYGDYAQKGDDGTSFRDDTGGASRFFYCAKPSTAERNTGLEDFYWKKADTGHIKISKEEYDALSERERAFGNIHPTVKPVSLMQWLIKLITPKNGHILDPHSGTGTTGIAGKIEGFSCTLIDNDANSCLMTQARIDGWQLEKINTIPSLFKNLL